MALVRCPDCGSEVSDQAAACPQCARPIRAAQPSSGKPVPRKTSPATWGCLILIVVAVIGAVISQSNQSGSSSSGTDPEQAKKDAAVQRAVLGARVLKKAMRDPDSFKLESALVIDGSRAVCYDYRAKNGFGGYNTGHAVLAGDGTTFKTNEMPGFTKLWNKQCSGKQGIEEATAINWSGL
jgi:hypothetical protein